ncbi:hypothetical protein HU200_040839 [Digitaria exilis]|uniref:DUF4220 domain-containing protein n=1 Tax=Digitaria exilis TaxID=1010633 RepID=A0A835EFV6_9POAL|nr:hypothetical protein HU200_040839 [Digitaria exilis]
MMDGGNVTTNCTTTGVGQCSPTMFCSITDDIIQRTFQKRIAGHIWWVNALVLAGGILAGVIVVIGAFRQQYRHHPITRFLFLGATTLFLPIISSVISTVGVQPDYLIPLTSDSSSGSDLSALGAICRPTHSAALIVWAFIVQIVMINTSTVVSVEDREGQSKGPPFELLVQGLWTLYLGVSLIKQYPHQFSVKDLLFDSVLPFGLLFAKLTLKYYAFEKARKSFALGRNPGLVFVYMLQLRARVANQNCERRISEEASPPQLLLMREDEQQVEQHPCGYAFKDGLGTKLVNNSTGLVTMDMVWQLDSMVPIITPQLKDICLSFALFKLLRCRFARYKLVHSGSHETIAFFRSLFLKVGEHDRVFSVIMDELSFVHDCYFSSLSTSYSKWWVPIVSIILSLWSIGYWTVFVASIISIILTGTDIWGIKYGRNQLLCKLWCIKQPMVSGPSDAHMGKSLLDMVPLLLVLVLAVTAEVRDTASYICSNWTKVALVCSHVASPQRPLCVQKWVSLLLQCRCKLMKHWDERMGQCSVLVLSPRTGTLAPLRRLLHLPDKEWKLKVPAAVKVSVINSLRNSLNDDGRLRHGAESLRRSQIGQSFLWACNGKGTSYTILLGHIATCVLEMKPSYSSGTSDNKIAATHLSRYCAYLMTWSPDLLPDSSSWSKSLYEEVKKDAERALAEVPADGSLTPEDEYQQVVQVLSVNAKHEVLKNGVKLGEQLVLEMIKAEEAVWKLLADFWSEMILYIAPSDNLKEHSEAIARGGELITLLWALLFHAGIVNRPGED